MERSRTMRGPLILSNDNIKCNSKNHIGSIMRVNIIIGRFQPITTGHLKCMEEAYKKGFKTVICMIETVNPDKRHPFPSNMLFDLYDYTNVPFIEDIILVKSADIVKIGQTLKEKGYEIASWTCGTDRYKDYKRMTDKYAEQAELSNDFELIEIPRTDEDVSATKVRKALIEHDVSTFNSLYPFDNKVEAYEVLEKQIGSVI